MALILSGTTGITFPEGAPLGANSGGTGLESPGESGNVLVSDGTTWTSTTPSSSAGTLEFIATGTLSDGSTVAINSDGTVSAVSGTAQTIGSSVVFKSDVTPAGPDLFSAVYDELNGKVVIFYRDGSNSNFAKAVVGTVSGSSITFGTEVILASASLSGISAVYDTTNDKVVVCYLLGTTPIEAAVGTVSGNSISFGTPVQIAAARGLGLTTLYIENQDRVVVIYSDDSNSRYGTYAVGQVSGTTISFGTPTVLVSQDVSSFFSFRSFNLTGTDNIFFQLGYAQQYNIGTLSGSTITLQTPIPMIKNFFNSAFAFDTENNVVVSVYRDPTTPFYAIIELIKVTGTTLESLGYANISNVGPITNGPDALYDSNSKKIYAIVRNEGGRSWGTLITGFIENDAFKLESTIFYSKTNTEEARLVLDTANKALVTAFKDTGNSGRGTSVVIKLVDTNSNKYIGISDGAYSNGQTATVQIVGSVNGAQSGLTTGGEYYVQPDGSLSIQPAIPRVFAGTAVSATELIVKG